MYFCNGRRLYPDMAFFQWPTDYPCQLILDPQNDYETLRCRVEQTTLKAQTVDRNRSGVTNVSLTIRERKCVCLFHLAGSLAVERWATNRKVTGSNHRAD